MMQNAEVFHELSVVDFQSEDDWDGTKHAYRFRSDWESKPGAMKAKLDEFASLQDAALVKAIVIGMWGSDSQDNSKEIIDKLVSLSSNFPKLTGLFIGDIAQEENEISWIMQSDMSPLLKAYPQLQELKVRGGSELSFSPAQNDSLEMLTIETGGLPRSVLRELTRCQFPNLKALELWIGTDQYGWDGGTEDLQPILSGKYFPKLESLGICNCDGVDEYVPVIVNSPIVQRLKTLSITKGNLTDVGAQSLLELKSPTLKTLDLSYHYLTPAMVKNLQKKLSCKVIAEEPQDPDEEWRSIYVSE